MVDGAVATLQILVGKVVGDVVDYHRLFVANERGVVLALPKELLVNWALFHGSFFFCCLVGVGWVVVWGCLLGIMGILGPIGIIGIIGSMGILGILGPIGILGLMGILGIIGSIGILGLIGILGIMGDRHMRHNG